MKQFLLGLLFCFTFFLPASAQQSVVMGRAIDARSGDGLSFASVRVDHNAGTTTDSLGNFTLSLEPGKHQVTVSKVGYTSLYQTVRLGIEERVNIVFSVEPFTSELNRVVVSSSKQERQLVREPVSITSIQPYLIENTNANTLSDVLNKVPGVSVIEGQAIIRGAVGWSYNVGSRVMVVLDDMPLMGPDLGDVQWDLLPIEAAENIEVLKGPSSALYGSSASSGTITVRTGWPTNKPQTKIQTYQGITGNPRNQDGIWWERTSQPFNSGAFFSHKQKFGQFDLVASGNLDAVRSYIQLNDSYRSRMYVKTRYRFKSIPGLSAGVNGSLLFKKNGRFFLWDNGDSGMYTPWTGSAGEDFYRIWSIDPHITYTKPGNYTLSLKFRHYNITRFYDKGDDTATYTGGRNDAVANIQAIDLNFQKKLFRYFSATTGVYMTRLWAVGNVYPGNHTGYTMAAFINAEYQHKRITANAGLRYEFNALGPISETPRPLFRAGLNYQAAEKTFVRVTYGEGYRFPTIAERYVQDKVKVLEVLPNPDLKSERGWYTEIGIKKGFSIGNFQATADFAFFWQEYRNLIEFQFSQWVKPSITIDTVSIPPVVKSDPGKIGFKAVNIPETRTAGAELTLEGAGKIGEIGIKTLCGYTYTYPVNLQTDTTLRDFGNYMKGFVNTFSNVDSAEKSSILPYRNRKLVKIDIELSYKKYSIGYGAFYYSVYDKIDQPLYDFVPGVKDFLTSVGDGDWVHNIRAAYQINQNVTIAFLVNNVANHSYAIRPTRMDPPRNFNLQFRMRF